MRPMDPHAKHTIRTPITFLDLRIIRHDTGRLEHRTLAYETEEDRFALLLQARRDGRITQADIVVAITILE